LRARGIRVGTTTGYTRAMMDVLAPAAAAQGFAPDAVVASDEVREARPAPDMCLRNLALLGVSDARACVKVDDTTAGIEEGLRAGMWTIGLVMTGNELGLTAPELAALPEVERARRRQAGYARLYAAGAHLVVDGIADVPHALETLAARRLSRAA
jgi:phosphonoacetaldehyde hydrolase